jgi:hypothetical protein
MKRIGQELGTAFAMTDLETMGLELTHREKLELGSIQLAVDETLLNVRRAAAIVRTLLKSRGLTCQRPRLEELERAIAELQKQVGHHRPVSICAACKRIPRVTSECTTCFGAGYMTATQVVEPPLKDLENPAVRYRGQIVPVERLQ